LLPPAAGRSQPVSVLNDKKIFRVVFGHVASNRYRLSLVYEQLKVGSAYQRHLFSPAETFLSRNST